MATTRIKKELRDLAKSPVEGLVVEPSAADMFIWDITIEGPANTPYEGGKFKCKCEFPPDYPFKAPKLKMITKLFHVNVNDQGYICMDILSNNWSPVLNISKLMISFMSFLTDPNPDHALVPERAKLLKSNKDEYLKTAKEWTEKYAM